MSEHPTKFLGQCLARRPGTIMMADERYVDPLHMREEDFKIESILWGLPKLCRFTGQNRRPTWGSLPRQAWRYFYNYTGFYPVAQHCTIGARFFLDTGQRELARWFALHDGWEHVGGDMAKPIKMQPEMDFYRGAEHSGEMRMATKFGLSWPMPRMVKIMDNVLLATEVRDLMGDPPWEGLPTPLKQRIEPWMPNKAYREYRDVLQELSLL